MNIIKNKFIAFLLILIITFSICIPVFADFMPRPTIYDLEQTSETQGSSEILEKLREKILTGDFLKNLINRLRKVLAKIFDFFRDLLNEDEEVITEETFKEVEYLECAQMDVSKNTGNRYVIEQDGEKIKLSYESYSIEGWKVEKENELTLENLKAISKKIDELEVVKKGEIQNEPQSTEDKITFSYLIKFKSETSMHEDIFYNGPEWKEELIKTFEEYFK